MHRNISMDMSTSSSQEIVLDKEDLLTLILLHLPYRKLMSLKCVSKKWHSLITTPHFNRLLRNVFPLLRASALLMQKNPGEAYFVSLDGLNTTSPFRPCSPQQISILQSCNGLLLCSKIILNSFNRDCCVYNISTNHLATLPEHPLACSVEVYYFGLTYDPLKSLHYKVISFVHTSHLNTVGKLHIYSSETRTWKASKRCFILSPEMKLHGGVYWNGCIHWLTDDSYCFYFNVDKEMLNKIPRPPISDSGSRMSLYFGESEDHLHVIEVCPYATSLIVYEMKSDYSKWFVKYQIDLDPITKVFPEMIKRNYSFFDDTENEYSVASVLSLIRREKFREDSFLVLEIPGKVIRYNLVDKSFKLIWDFGVTLNPKKEVTGIGSLKLEVLEFASTVKLYHVHSYS